MAKRPTVPTDAGKDAASGLVGGTRDRVVPLSKKAAKEVQRLEQKLAAATATEAKRLRQLAAAQAGKGEKEITKRRKQAKEAAAEVASLTARLASVAGSK